MVSPALADHPPPGYEREGTIFRRLKSLLGGFLCREGLVCSSKGLFPPYFKLMRGAERKPRLEI